MIVIIIAGVILIFFIILIPSREDELKKQVIISRSNTFKNEFEVWSDISTDQIDRIDGVTSTYYSKSENSVRVCVDPRTGRKVVISKILDMVNSEC